jgi:hypothetical protein
MLRARQRSQQRSLQIEVQRRDNGRPGAQPGVDALTEPVFDAEQQRRSPQQVDEATRRGRGGSAHGLLRRHDQWVR